MRAVLGAMLGLCLMMAGGCTAAVADAASGDPSDTAALEDATARWTSFKLGRDRRRADFSYSICSADQVCDTHTTVRHVADVGLRTALQATLADANVAPDGSKLTIYLSHSLRCLDADGDVVVPTAPHASSGMVVGVLMASLSADGDLDLEESSQSYVIKGYGRLRCSGSLFVPDALAEQSAFRTLTVEIAGTATH